MNKQSIITILLTVLMSMTGAKAFAHDIEVANNEGVTIYYKWANNNTELVVSYQGSSGSYYGNEYTGNVIIPKSVDYNGNTYPVTSISNSAFYYCYRLTSVTIPSSVTSIGDYAFCGCSSITSVTIPNSVTSIGEGAFDGCISMTSVTFPNSVTSIVKGAFSGSAWYNNQPDGLVYAGKVAYTYKGTMPENTIVTIKDGTLGIADYAFSGFPNLTSVNIPNSVTSIGNYAFADCSGLSTIVSEIETPFEIGNIASNSVTLIVPVSTKVAYQSTDGWNSFTKIFEVGEGGYVGDRFEINGIHYKIGENNTATLTSTNKAISGAFAIPSQVELNGKKYDVTSISDGAFSSCSGLISVTIPNSVTSIDSYAFHFCSNLTSVTIPNSVTSIGMSAFAYCI